MDNFISYIVKAQREDGYIHTPVIIEEMNRGVDTHSTQRPHRHEQEQVLKDE
jgi:hypothetical protein